jgi:hypothetical protein
MGKTILEKKISLEIADSCNKTDKLALSNAESLITD